MTFPAPEPIPDLVDLAEIVERLGVGPTIVARWHRRSLLPRHDLKVGDEKIWLWSTIYYWAGHRNRTIRSLRPPESGPVPIVLTALDIAERLNVPPRTVAGWIRRGDIPDPDYRWQAIDSWLADTIDEWVRLHAGRIPGLPREHHLSLHDREVSGPSLHVPGSEDEPG